MPNYPDARYDRTRPWQAPVTPPEQDKWLHARPNETLMETLATDALRRALDPQAAMGPRIGPPLSQVQVFPARFGYPGYAQRQATVREIIDISRTNDDDEPRDTYFRSSPAGYEGTSRNTLGNT
jgi:hypothetical protein